MGRRSQTAGARSIPDGRISFARISSRSISRRKIKLTINISEITEITMKLTPVMEKFILHWGEMGWRWGINRSVAQVHALLMMSPKPLPADEICATLDVARSNVSTSLKELQGWGLIRVVHEFGDRREHFETLKDVWEMFLIIL